MGPEAAFVTKGKCHFGKKTWNKSCGRQNLWLFEKPSFCGNEEKKLIHLSRLLSLLSELEAKRGAERKRTVHERLKNVSGLNSFR